MFYLQGRSLSRGNFNEPFHSPHHGDEMSQPFIPRPGDEFGEPLDYLNDEEAEGAMLHGMNRSLMGSQHDPFSFQETDTSVLSSLPRGDLDDSLNSYGDSSGAEYAMGPVLKAMIEEWAMGDELLAKKKRRRKTSHEQQQ